RLRFFEHRVERRAALLHLRENVVARTVQNAVEGLQVIARYAFAQHRMDGDPAADAGFHGEVDAGADRAIPNFWTACGDQFRVGCTYSLGAPDACLPDSPRLRRAATQRRDDLPRSVGTHCMPFGDMDPTVHFP